MEMEGEQLYPEILAGPCFLILSSARQLFRAPSFPLS